MRVSDIVAPGRHDVRHSSTSVNAPSSALPPPPRLAADHFICLPTGSAPCAITAAPNRAFESHVLHFTLSSPTMPPTPYAYDMASRTLNPRAMPSEPHSSIGLTCELVHALARDGAKIPVTLYHDAALQPDSRTPLHVLVYGAYGGEQRMAGHTCAYCVIRLLLMECHSLCKGSAPIRLIDPSLGLLHHSTSCGRMAGHPSATSRARLGRGSRSCAHEACILGCIHGSGVVCAFRECPICSTARVPSLGAGTWWWRAGP